MGPENPRGLALYERVAFRTPAYFIYLTNKLISGLKIKFLHFFDPLIFDIGLFQRIYNLFIKKIYSKSTAQGNLCSPLVRIAAAAAPHD